MDYSDGDVWLELDFVSQFVKAACGCSGSSIIRIGLGTSF